MWSALLVLYVACIKAQQNGPFQCYHENCTYLGRFEFEEDRYNVDGHELWIMYGDSERWLRIQCLDYNMLESPAIPRAVYPLTIWNLNFAYCNVPYNYSLSGFLAKLNITMEFSDLNATAPRGNLTIEGVTSTYPITSHYFTGLENLALLSVYGLEGHAQESVKRNFISRLQNLRVIKIEHVILPDGEFNIPSSVRQLFLTKTGVQRLSKTVYLSRSLLELIIESENALDAVEVPPALRFLNIQSPATTVRLDTAHMLEEISLIHWTELHPPLFPHCDNLHKMFLSAPAMTTLPKGWLANCINLEELIIEHARNLITLPQMIFGNLHYSLKHVVFKNGSLEELSEGQFGISRISALELQGNRLRTIPRATLPTSYVTLLDFSSNDLDSSVLEILSECTWIDTLNLAYNPRIGDVCNESERSPIFKLRRLKTFQLQNTNVTRICRDWRENMTLLQKLDLSNTKVSTLSFEDVQFQRFDGGAEVLLQGCPITMLKMTRDQFLKAKHFPTSGVFIRLDNSSKFECDCRMYWTRRTLESSPHALDRISELYCSSGLRLRDLTSEEMLCEERCDDCAVAALPPGCGCNKRPDDDSTQERQLVRVRCEDAQLQHVPQIIISINSTNNLYELLLARNLITHLHANDLQNVKGLDLRSNFLKQVDLETTIRLSNMNGALLLADNPLDCDCKAAPLLQALHGRTAGYTDLNNITCGDGRIFYDVPVAECPSATLWLTIGFLIIFVVSVATTIYLSSRQRRFFVKAVLYRWGCRCCVETDEEERRYDAFMTFSHKDQMIASELAARLEPPYRLCLHYRDWVPGLRIPDQIIESVRNSHRTVALVSRHFLASTWARAEFREAHETAMLEDKPRLIVVLLEEPSKLPLDEQLQRYIASHTYLCWGETWFYNKLAVAMPRPRHPQTALPVASFTSPASVALL